MFRQPAVRQHDFSNVPTADVQRSAFDRTHRYSTTLDADVLVPFFWDLAYPGDDHTLKSTHFGRLNTPIVPIMDSLFLDTFYFFCPLRLLQDNFVKMMGEQRNPSDSISYLAPTVTSPSGGWLEQTLFDYLRVPTKKDVTIVNYIGRSYNWIWNNWFRDENLQNSVVEDRDDGPDSQSDYTLLKRGKRFDYFTSALPFVQKGPAVSIPLGTKAPINLDRPTGGAASVYSPTVSARRMLDSSGTNLILSASTNSDDTMLYADLTSATAATINALRLAFQTQAFYERDARGGTRYVELVQSHFNVTDPLALVLSRPQYLGGGSSEVNIHPVAQTSGTSASGTSTPLGNLAAMGTVVCNSGFQKGFTEHGIIIGLMCIRGQLTYQQGLDKLFTIGKTGRFDFYFPAFSHIGEQPIYNSELMYQNTSDDNLVFGYNEPFAFMRFYPNSITGLLRANATGTLKIWTLAQNFSSLPALNSTFIQQNFEPIIDGVIATPTQPQFIMDVHNQYTSVRVMPTHGVPSSLARF